MGYRIAVVLVGIAFVAYRVSFWLALWRARRAGDTARERLLRRHGFGLYRWALLGVLVFIGLLTVLVWSNSR